MVRFFLGMFFKGFTNHDKISIARKIKYSYKKRQGYRTSFPVDNEHKIQKYLCEAASFLKRGTLAKGSRLRDNCL